VDVQGALGIYRGVLRDDPCNFHANFRLAELLAVHYPNDDSDDAAARKGRLDEAYRCMCEAKGERPQACYVWKLLSWIQFQRFVLECDGGTACHEPPCKTYLHDAVRYATHSLQIADGNMDEYGAAVAKIFLIVYLHERVRNRFESAEDDRQQASRYLDECQQVIDRGPGGWLESMYKTVKAKVMYTSNPRDRSRALKLAIEALSLNPLNRLAAEFVQSLQ